MPKTRKVPAPPNLAARALRNGLFRQRKVRNAKAYSRKTKYKKGEHDNHGSPFCWPMFGPIAVSAPLKQPSVQK